LDEQAWDAEPSEVKDYYLLGFPEQLNAYQGNPIVALTPPNSEGTALYNLVASQRPAIGRDIKGMLMPPLGELLRDLLKGQIEISA